jgi:ATP-binding cassette, subfamily B, multidrug efflux pump
MRSQLSVYPNVRRFMREYPYSYRVWYFWGVMCLLMTILIATKLPLYVGELVEILERGNFSLDGNTDQLIHLSLLILVMGVVLTFVRTLSRVLIFMPGRKIESQVREDMYDSLLHLSGNSQWSSGDLISTGTNDVTSVRVMISMGVLHSINTLLTVAFCLFYMCQMSWSLTLFSMLPLVLVVPVTRLISKGMMAAGRGNQRELGRLTEVIREHFRAHALMAVFPVYSQIIKRVDEANKKYADVAIRFMSLRVLIMFMVTLVSGVGIFVLLRVGLVDGEGVSQEIGVSTLVAFMLYLWHIQGPLRAAGFLLPLLQRGEISLERLYSVRDEADVDRKIEAARAIQSAEELEKQATDSKTLIQMKNFTFSYAGQESAVQPFKLRIDSIEIQQGKKYGFFGPTGSGKSTLLKLLTGELRDGKGELLIHGVNAAALNKKVFHELFTQVPQECRHFGMTIRENIEMVESNAGDRGQKLNFEEAVRVSCLEPDLDKLSDGLDTLLGEHGINLSGGQKQRLAILRALICRAELLVMDDFISAVDHSTEVKIIDELYKHTEGRSMLMISHRVSALRGCDEIFLMDEGRIVDRGAHDDLMHKNESYRSICEYQEKSDVLSNYGVSP